jgi:alkyldihydroxyacetonephosphate synthase
MEGTVKEVAIQEEKLNGIGLEFHGIPAGEHNGKRGYQLTFAIAYIRVTAFFRIIIISSFKLTSFCLFLGYWTGLRGCCGIF